ncbi:MAG: hypothetical protein M3N57_05380 [Actinomycetota bacterium]|nr:hypothetical protein [Actinomycetota bacterium]
MRAAWRLRRLLGSPPPPPRALFSDWSALAAGVLVVCHPQWRGIRTAAIAHGEPVVEVADAAASADALADRIATAGVRVVVIHGYPPGSAILLRRLTHRGVGTRVVLHSSMAQHGGEAHEAAVVDEVAALAADGVVDRIGFVKDGMAEVFEALGYPAAWVPNRAPHVEAFEPRDLGAGRTHVGVFAEPFWRKNVVTQLGAVALLEPARAHVLRRPDVAYLGRLDVVEHGVLPWDDFVRLQGSVDVNLYVTLSECYPLSPVESYLAGVPCLMSRTSSVFRDDADLWELTTVAEADDPRAIARGARHLLDRRDEAVAAARAWIARWDAIATEKWQRFTE